LFLNNPTNPTGSVYKPNELEALIKVFEKYNLTVFADEIYFNTSQVETISLSALYDKCIIGSSLSKDWASGGWRFGWMVFPDKLSSLHERMVSFGSSMYSCPSEFFNNVAADALLNIKKEYYFIEQRRFFKEISDKVDLELEKNKKILHSNFEGGWYKWIDLRNYQEKLYKMNIKNSKELTDSLGNQLGLIVVPGECFGVEGLTFRLSMVDTNIYLGIRKMIEWLES
jgi:aspartate aminotransferase